MTNPLVRTIGLWVLRILVALVFLAAGSQKLLGAPAMIDVFAKIGVGQWFRLVTGAIEVATGLLILWPRTSFWGALLTQPILVGAFVTQLVVLHGDVIHVIVISALAGVLAWLQRSAVLPVRDAVKSA